MIFPENQTPRPAWRDTVAQNFRADEDRVVETLLEEARLSPEATKKIYDRARELVVNVRKGRRNQGGIDYFMQQYDLSTQEGLVLMCLAEALLRIPDAATADKLIEDKLSGTHWEEYLGQSESIFVNASTIGLMITGKILHEDHQPKGTVRSIMNRLIKRSGEPVIRQAMKQAMKIMGFQFVLGRTIDEALKRAKEGGTKGYRYSFDMLGEAARTHQDAQRYFKAYENAIAALTKAQTGKGPVEENGISVKLSALHPRYEVAKRERVLVELSEKLLELAKQAKAANIGFTIDAEEAARLELSLEVIERVFMDPALDGWEGFGVVVQAYQKRARQVIDMLAGLSRRANRKMMIRLVKGAYWDSELKLSQELGLENYPVFTRKASSDVSYVACAKALLNYRTEFYPQFATHNAYTVATIMEMAKGAPFEFQRLHGMGDPLYGQIVGTIPVRVYAPVGSHEDLLSYLVRRLLENGANSSFVNRLVDDKTPIEDILADPVAYIAQQKSKKHPHIPLPKDIYGEGRVNSKGMDINNTMELDIFAHDMKTAAAKNWVAAPMGAGQKSNGTVENVVNPFDTREVVGKVTLATPEDVEAAIASAHKAAPGWDRTPATKRADILRKGADLLEEHTAELIALCNKEAGKVLSDGVAEIREAVDFLRYYANQAEKHFAKPEIMPGPTGEHNELQLHGRGVFACISPWNFPLAIFLGQVTAALAAGNAVIAKPAEQTPLIAARAVELLYQAGVPQEVLHLLPGTGQVVGAALVNDQRVNGICFTGSNETASLINRNLAARPGAITPLIAETGGQNGMIVDSSALLEATVADVVMSAFGSAGQRCSALRVLYIQDDVADKFIELLQGAMAELTVGNPALLSTDVGPVIDEDARANLQSHIDLMSQKAKTIAKINLPEECANGTFVAPHAFEISSINDIGREVFGPILHVVRWSADKLDAVIDEINSTGFGLTCGIQTRIDGRAEYIQSRIHAGNCYVNRNITGAVVGVQPFGGEGLSGTGPKAGGPHYILRFASERTLTINITASGGNASLLTLDENATSA